MLAYLQGILVEKQPTSAVIEVNGVGYFVNIPLSTFEVLPPIKQNVRLLIHYHVRDDIPELYGFATREEKELFLMLITISGIGPKMAITILSGASPAQFKARIQAGDEKALRLIPGIGPKTAKRILVELGEKLGAVDTEMPLTGGSAALNAQADEVIKALLSLGYRRAEAFAAVQKACQELGENASIEHLLKAALQKM